MNYDFQIIGGLFGYIYFLYGLESSDMGNIIFRCGEFAPGNILAYMINPFYKPFLWYPYLWRSNWIITTLVGMGFGLLISKVKF